MSQSSVWYDCGFNVTCIDTGLFRDGLAACYLIEHDGEAALVDTGTRNSLPRIMQTLADHNISPEQVRWIMPTHVHLDHAGGAGALMDEMPEATLVVHERGARHMITPEKLQAGSLAVYGEEAYDAAFGQLVPVPEQRVCIAADGDSFDLGSRRLQTLNTAGHARHHYVVWDEHSSGLFTGDTFGVSYPELNTGRGSRFIGAAFELSVGQISDVVVQNNGAYLLRLTERPSIDESAFAEARVEVEAELLQARRNEALQTWFAQIFESADIEDHRHLFYSF